MSNNANKLTEKQAALLLNGWIAVALFLPVLILLLVAPPLGIALAIGVPLYIRAARRRERHAAEAAALEHKRIWGW